MLHRTEFASTKLQPFPAKTHWNIAVLNAQAMVCTQNGVAVVWAIVLNEAEIDQMKCDIEMEN